jgi:hypothetical protein
MKSILLLLVALALLSCTDQVKANSTLPEVNDQMPNARITMDLEIVSILPMGWGYHYRSKILSASSHLGDHDSIFFFSVSVGSEEFYLPMGKATLIFERTGELAEHSYIPSGTTGTLDKDGEVWNLIESETLDTGEVDEDKSNDSKMHVLNQFTVDVHLTKTQEIGYGSSYDCTVISFLNNAKPALNSDFTFYYTEQSEEFRLIEGDDFRITFDKLVRNQKLPEKAKSSRINDNKGEEWFISKLEPR